jgi:hypothetical protein
MIEHILFLFIISCIVVKFTKMVFSYIFLDKELEDDNEFKIVIITAILATIFIVLLVVICIIW